MANTESNVRRRYFFHKFPDVDFMSLHLDSHLISETLFPNAEDSLLVCYGKHKKNLGPEDIRKMTYLEVLDYSKKLSKNEFCCIDVLGNPSVDFIENPDLEVSNFSFDMQ